MTQSISDIERDIEESRARLDLTIERLQGRLSVPAVMDDLVGSMRGRPGFDSVYDRALTVVRQNPIPVALVAVGIGWLIHRMTSPPRTVVAVAPRRSTVSAVREDEADIPVINTGQAHVYDPDASPLHPTQDSLESRRAMNAQA
jgi:hypothetical protein